LITPPAVLLPSNIDLNVFGLESSGSIHFHWSTSHLFIYYKSEWWLKYSLVYSHEPYRLLLYGTQLSGGSSSEGYLIWNKEARDRERSAKKCIIAVSNPWTITNTEQRACWFAKVAGEFPEI
jgi:hypothetical protein